MNQDETTHRGSFPAKPASGSPNGDDYALEIRRSNLEWIKQDGMISSNPGTCNQKMHDFSSITLACQTSHWHLQLELRAPWPTVERAPPALAHFNHRQVKFDACHSTETCHAQPVS
jgi:hypothetical protein